ncbi:MAG: GNAT family N-acetyltransferase [Lentisphaeria bacterium]|jgi:predicted N-acetyltransferase YhbS|nr:GNAT family N-acetyltransferase [Lentisphaeria bacterium]MDP7742569.1 GNAT family N-acetyltransferase [Lentisphaeria bacterium]
MNDEIERLSATDFEELIEFLDGAFGYSAVNSFRQLLPLIYQPTDALMSCNLAIRRAGRIAAIVGVFPITWHFGDTVLRVAGVGGVATGHELRGQGLMGRLMEHASECIREGGYHLSLLGGQRQRYNYYGWETAGVRAGLTVSRVNLRHTGAGRTVTVQLERLDADDLETVRVLKGLHDSQISWCEYADEAFPRYLVNWNATAHVARDDGGKIIGYAMVDEAGTTVVELVVDNSDVACAVVRALIEREGGPDEVAVITDRLPACFVRALAAVAENSTGGRSGNWQIHDWPAVTGAALAFGCAAQALPAGELVLAIEGLDQAIRLQVGDHGTVSEYTDAEPDLRLPPMTATRLLFGPLAPAAVVPLEGKAKTLQAWCPLPLSLSGQDQV